MKNSVKYGFLKSALVVFALGACSHGGESPRYATGAEVEKRNKVEMVRMPYLVLAEKGSSAALSESSLKGLESFMAEIALQYGDVIVMDQGDGVSADRVQAVAKEFRRRGMEVGETDGVFGPAPAAGNLMVYVERYVVHLPDCPDFSSGSMPDWQNAGSPNFGCSTVSSLGLMVANPRDLVDGQSDPSSTVEPQIKAARSARTGRNR